MFTFPIYDRSLLSLEVADVMVGPWEEPQALNGALSDLGLSSNHLPICRVSLDAVQRLSYITLGGWIFWKKSDTWLGLFESTFAETAHREMDLEVLTSQLLEAVQSSPQPETAWLWVKDPKQMEAR